MNELKRTLHTLDGQPHEVYGDAHGVSVREFLGTEVGSISD